jgi:protein-tyrosine-phosphatase
VSATGWDPTDWDKKLKDLEAIKYVLFIGVDRPHSRIVQLAQADDWSITKQTERPRTYIWDLRDPLQDDIDGFEEYERQMDEERERWLDK